MIKHKGGVPTTLATPKSDGQGKTILINEWNERKLATLAFRKAILKKEDQLKRY